MFCGCSYSRQNRRYITTVSNTWAGSCDSRAGVASWHKSLLNKNNKEKRIVILTRHRFVLKILNHVPGIQFTLKKWKTLFRSDRRCRYAAPCWVLRKEHTGTCVRVIVVFLDQGNSPYNIHLKRNLEIYLFSLKFIVYEPWLHWFVCPNTLFYRWICCRPHCICHLKAVSCVALTFFLSKNIMHNIIRS